MEVTGGSPASSTLPYYVWKQGLSLDFKSTASMGVASWWALGVHLCLLPNAEVRGTCTTVSFKKKKWTLGIWTQVPILTWQALLLTEPSLLPHSMEESFKHQQLSRHNTLSSCGPQLIIKAIGVTLVPGACFSGKRRQRTRCKIRTTFCGGLHMSFYKENMILHPFFGEIQPRWRAEMEC